MSLSPSISLSYVPDDFSNSERSVSSSAATAFFYDISSSHCVRHRFICCTIWLQERLGQLQTVPDKLELSVSEKRKGHEKALLDMDMQDTTQSSQQLRARSVAPTALEQQLTRRGGEIDGQSPPHNSPRGNDSPSRPPALKPSGARARRAQAPAGRWHERRLLQRARGAVAAGERAQDQHAVAALGGQLARAVRARAGGARGPRRAAQGDAISLRRSAEDGARQAATPLGGRRSAQECDPWAAEELARARRLAEVEQRAGRAARHFGRARRAAHREALAAGGLR
jgi:hypothetical protein